MPGLILESVFRKSRLVLVGAALASLACAVAGASEDLAPTLTTEDLLTTEVEILPSSPSGFLQVAQLLEDQGSFYMIWDLGASLRGAAQDVSWLGDMTGQSELRFLGPLIRQASERLGLAQVGYFGRSVRRNPQGWTSTRTVLQTPRPRGLLALPGEPRPLNLLEVAPADTAVLGVLGLESGRLAQTLGEFQAFSPGQARAAVGRLVNRSWEPHRREDPRWLSRLAKYGDEIGFLILMEEPTTGSRYQRLRRAAPSQPRMALMAHTPTETLFQDGIDFLARRGWTTSTESLAPDWTFLEGPALPRTRDLRPILAHRPGLTVFADSTGTLARLRIPEPVEDSPATSPVQKLITPFGYDSLPQDLLMVWLVSQRPQQDVGRMVRELLGQGLLANQVAVIMDRFVTLALRPKMSHLTLRDGFYILETRQPNRARP
jgi:hypothetical protein